jgi:hypothetical protein
MADEQNTEQLSEWEVEEQKKQDAQTKRAAEIQADVHEQRIAAKKEKNLASMSQSEWRKHVLEKYGYDPS